jgi:EmrB/QacA subfamily drug resistance transporter
MDSGSSARRSPAALFAILLAFFMDLLDTTIVNVALPALQQGLSASRSQLQWILAGYTLTFALFLMAGGRLGDIFGYRRLFLVGTTGFTLASAACGLARSPELLIAARLLQGLMAAAMVPQILALTQVMYPSTAQRQHVSAYYGALAGVATVGGPVLGALLIAWDFGGLGWRMIFLVNLPVGVVALGLAARHLPAARSTHAVRFDSAGVCLLLLAMTLLLVPIIEGPALAWPLWTRLALAVSPCAFGAFALQQRSRDRRDRSALAAPALFRARSFVFGNLLIGLFFAVVSGFFLAFTLFLQIGLGYSVLRAGMTGVPFSLAVSGTSILVTRWLLPRLARRAGEAVTPRRCILSAGPLLMAAGLAGLAGCVHLYGAVLTPWHVLPPLLLAGLGMGCVVSSMYPFVLADVPLAEAGAASGIVNAVNQIGGALGIAGIGAVFFSALGDAVERTGYLAAMEQTVGWLVGLLLVTFGLSFGLPARPHPRVHSLQPPVIEATP